MKKLFSVLFLSKVHARACQSLCVRMTMLLLLLTLSVGSAWGAETMNVSFKYGYANSAVTIDGEMDYLTAATPTKTSSNYSYASSSGYLQIKTSKAGETTAVSFKITAVTAIKINGITINSLANSDRIKNASLQYRIGSGSLSEAQNVTFATSSAGNVNVDLPVDGISLNKGEDLYVIVNLTNTDTGSSSRGWAINTMSFNIDDPRTETGEGNVIFTLTKASDVVSGRSSGVNSITNLSTAFSKQTLSIGSSNSKEGYCGQITGQTVEGSTNYVALQFDVKAGFQISPSAVGLKVQTNAAGMKIKAVLTDGKVSVESEELTSLSNTDENITFAPGEFNDKVLTGTIKLYVYQWGLSGRRTYIKSPVTISGVVEEYTPPTPPSTKTVYLNPGVWNTASAKFAIYYFKGEDNGWSNLMTEVPCANGIYKTTIPSWATTVIAVRLSNDATAGTWDKKWNQSDNIVLTSYDYIQVTDWGEDKSPTTYNSSYTAPSFSVTYKANGGTGDDVVVNGIACGDSHTVKAADTFTRTNWSFLTWKQGGTGTERTPGSTIDNITSDYTLYAHWEKWSISGDFDGTGWKDYPLVDGSVTIPVTSGANREFVVLYQKTDATDVGYKNTGTMTSDNCTGWTMSTDAGSNCKITPTITGSYIFSFNTETKQLSVTYPVQKYTVTYAANGGSGTMTDSNSPYNSGDQVTILANAFTAPAGMMFAGYKNQDDETVAAGDEFTITKNTTLTAQWVVDPRKKILYVTTQTGDLLNSDKLYTSLNGNVNYNVTVASSIADGYASAYDLIVLHESLGGSSASGGNLKAVREANVPVLNTKAYFYNDGRWNWGTPDAGTTQHTMALNTDYTNISSHPIFAGVTISDNNITVTSGSIADSKNFQSITAFTSGKEGYTLAKNTDNECIIHELTPAQRGGAAETGGTAKYLMISLYSQNFDLITADGLKLFNNAVTYLLGNTQWEPAAPSTYDVTITAAPAGYGLVNKASIPNVPSGTSISAEGNVLTVGSTTSTATAADATAEYTYAFDSWSWIPDGATITAATSVTANFTRTARVYGVTLNTNGGTINAGNVTEYTFGVGATLPTDVTKDGFSFEGWFDNEGLTGEVVTAIANDVTGAKIYWAKWTEVPPAPGETCKELNSTTLRSASGNIIGDATVGYNSTSSPTASGISISSNITFDFGSRKVSSFSFTATCGSDGKTNKYTIDGGAQQNLASSSTSEKTYTLTIPAEGATTIQIIKNGTTPVLSGFCYELKDAPVTYTYSVNGSFDSWADHAIEVDGNVTIEGLERDHDYDFKVKKTPSEGDAIWYGATADDNRYTTSGDAWTLDGEYNVHLTTGAAGNYQFGLAMDGENPQITVTYPAAYSITYVGGDGATGSMDPQTLIASGEEVTLTANAFAKTDYHFAGWKDQDENEIADGAQVTVTKDLTLTAQWIPAVTSVTVTAAGEKTTLLKGETVQLTATCLPNDALAADKVISWSSANSTLVSVSETGLVTANGVTDGTVITATSANGKVGQITIVVEASCDTWMISYWNDAQGHKYSGRECFTEYDAETHEWRTPNTFVLKEWSEDDQFWVGDGGMTEHSVIANTKSLTTVGLQTKDAQYRVYPGLNAVGYLRIYSNSSADNYYVAFEPTYVLKYNNGESWPMVEFAPTATANYYETNLVQIPASYIIDNLQCYVGTKRTGATEEFIDGKSNTVNMNTIGGLTENCGGWYGKFNIHGDYTDQNWYLSFIPYYNISYYVDGSFVEYSEFKASNATEQDRTISFKAAPEKQGYTFVGWKRYNSDVVIEAGGSYAVWTGMERFDAVWTEDPAPTACFSLTPKTNADAGEVSGEEADITGGSASTSIAMEKEAKGWKIESSKITVTLDDPLAVGSIVTVTYSINGSGSRGIKMTSEDGTTATHVFTQGSSGTYTDSYTVTSDDHFAGEYVLMFSRNTGNTTHLGAIAITNCGTACSAPTINSAAADDATIIEGGNTILRATATSNVDGTLTYQWYKSDNTVAGAAGADLQVSPVTTTTYYCVVTDSECPKTAKSSNVTITVTPAPTYTVRVNDPKTTCSRNTTAKAGQTVTITNECDVPGYALTGYTSVPEVSGTFNSETKTYTFTMPAYDVTLTAVWEVECMDKVMMWKNADLYDGTAKGEYFYQYAPAANHSTYFTLAFHNVGGQEESSKGKEAQNSSLNTGKTAGNYFTFVPTNAQETTGTISRVRFTAKVQASTCKLMYKVGEQWYEDDLTSKSTTADAQYDIDFAEMDIVGDVVGFGIKNAGTEGEESEGVWVRNMSLTICGESELVDPCPVPTITAQSEDMVNVKIGKADKELSVTTTDEVTYQWYTCDGNGNVIAPIQDATSSSLTIAKANQSVGLFYYICKLTASCSSERVCFSSPIAIQFVSADFLVDYTINQKAAEMTGAKSFGATKSSSVSQIAESSLTDIQLNGNWETTSTEPKTALTQKIGTLENSKVDADYLSMSFAVADNYYLDVRNVNVQVQPVTSDVQQYEAVLEDQYGTQITGSLSNPTNGKSHAIVFTYDAEKRFMGTVTLKIWASDTDTKGQTFRLNTSLQISGTVTSLPQPDLQWVAEPADGAVGGSMTIEAAATNCGAQTVTYSSSNMAVATVTTDGIVSYVAPGVTEIRASITGDGEHSFPSEVTIAQEITVKAASPLNVVLPSGTTIERGCTSTIDIRNQALSGEITYSSSDESIARIEEHDGKQQIVAVAKGDAVVTITQAESETYAAGMAAFSIKVTDSYLSITDDVLYAFTCTENTLASGEYTNSTNPGIITGSAASGASATLTGAAMSDINVVIAGEAQPFYKPEAASVWTFTLGDDKTFQAGDKLIARIAASNSGAKRTTIVFNGDESHTITIPAGKAVDVTYVIEEEDPLIGQNTFTCQRGDADLRMGSAIVVRPGNGSVKTRALAALKPGKDKSYSTFAAAMNWTLSSSDNVKAYTGVVNDQAELVLEEIDEDAVIPAYTGVLLAGGGGDSYSILWADDEGAIEVNGNEFIGTTEKEDQSDLLKRANGYEAVLYLSGTYMQFIRLSNSGSIAGQKALLPWNYSDVAPSPTRMIFPGDRPQIPTDVAETSDVDEARKVVIDGRIVILRGAKVFDLNGRLLRELKK